MDLQQIKELALLMQQTGLTSLHLTEGAVNIQMERQAQRLRCAHSQYRQSAHSRRRKLQSRRKTQNHSKKDTRCFPRWWAFLLCAFSAVQTLCGGRLAGQKGRCAVHRRGNETDE